MSTPEYEFYYDERNHAVVRFNGYPVLRANCDPSQGGISGEDAEIALRHACVWLNKRQLPDEQQEVKFTIRRRDVGGYVCLAYIRDADNKENWRQYEVAETADEAGALILKWQMFYEHFEREPLAH